MPRKRRFAIDGVRELARTRVERSSLRAVADEIGMSNSGLHSFLRGGEPYSPVRKKLVSWFMQVRDAERKPVQPDEVEVAQAVLASYIRQSGPSARARRFLKIYEQIAVEGGLRLSSETGKPAPLYSRQRNKRRS